MLWKAGKENPLKNVSNVAKEDTGQKIAQIACKIKLR